ncbi:MAG TPA: carbohydrate ABC transporter permease [Candidatus Atribacteria bacterium]|nr:carbohydrate ABC transporter permease [Candidatus Atribacteria bacterium]
MMVIVATISLAPFLWLFISSISTNNDLLSVPIKFIPSRPTFYRYYELFFQSGKTESTKMFLVSMKNSLIVSTFVTIITLILASFAAYAFARIEFPGKKSIQLSILATRMLPALSTIIPLYIFAKKFGLIDTKFILMILYLTFTLPFAIWMMIGFFQTIPKELEEAAMIDGATRIGTLFKVVFPLSAPGLTATAIFSFMLAWDEFFFALIFTSSYAAKTIPVAISEFTGRHLIDYGMMCTGGIVASIPPILLAMWFRSYIVKGLTQGAVKG